MKKIKFTLLILFAMFYSRTFSQGEFVVEINKTNGAFTKTGPAIAGITWIYPDDRTYDENTGTFIFPSSEINHSLYSINVSNGSIVNNPVIGDIKSFQFDNNSNILYGIEPDNANNVKNFISINPVTGTYAQIGNSIPGSSTFSGNLSGFDKANHTFIFLAPPDILYSINATNGNIVSSPALVLSSGESIVNFSFDNSSGILYGLLQDYNMQKYFLVVLNMTTGANVRIGSGTTFGDGGGSSTIDESNQQYIYLYSSSTAGGYVVTTLDIATGNLVYNALVDPFTANDNFFSLKFDNIQGKLYSIHWETDNTGISEQYHLNRFINIYPNPFSTQTTLRTNNPFNNATLSVYNYLGQAVKQIKNISGQTVILARDNLPSGLFFIHITQDNKTKSIDKLVITDN